MTLPPLTSQPGASASSPWGRAPCPNTSGIFAKPPWRKLKIDSAHSFPVSCSSPTPPAITAESGSLPFRALFGASSGRCSRPIRRCAKSSGRCRHSLNYRALARSMSAPAPTPKRVANYLCPCYTRLWPPPRPRGGGGGAPPRGAAPPPRQHCFAGPLGQSGGRIDLSPG
jgi:hypothetical protein